MPQPPLLCEEGNTPHSTFLQFIHTPMNYSSYVLVRARVVLTVHHGRISIHLLQLPSPSRLCSPRSSTPYGTSICIGRYPLGFHCMAHSRRHLQQRLPDGPKSMLRPVHLRRRFHRAPY